MRYAEATVPDNLRVHVVYLFKGRVSNTQLKKIGRTNTKYVTLAKLFDKETDKLVAEGIAACSAHDNPSRRVGRAVAIGRALQEYKA